ncbi:hypothetical protein L0222_02625 [bacterium]|nr:hypothetical protein [bacterium]
MVITAGHSLFDNRKFMQSRCSFATLVVYPKHQKKAQNSAGSFAASHSLFQMTPTLRKLLPPWNVSRQAAGMTE